MTNTKTTKRVLLVSLLSLLLCVSMLVGSTFAWFTDTATTGVNSIQSGTLDIDLVDKDGKSLDGKTIGFADLDENDLWEPGCRYTLEEVKLVNKGNLNAKFKVVINAVVGDINLAEVIEVYEGDSTTPIGKLSDFLNKDNGIKEGVIAPGQTLSFGTLKLVMQETAGNEYQSKAISQISITVFATQATVEKDSVDENYDKDATYFEKGESITSAELTTLIANDEDGVIELTSDVVVNETITISKDVTLTSKLNCAFTQGENFNADVFKVAENATLNLEGVAFKGIVLEYGEAGNHLTSQALIRGSENAKINFKNVSVANCTGTVVDAEGADVVLDRGTVMTHNIFTRINGQGGSLVNVKAGSVTINEGVVIEHNTCSYARDGLIAAYADGKIIMNGGKISNNVVTSGTVGSVIYVQGVNGNAATASFTMNGGEISNNKGIYASAVASRWCNGGSCAIALNAGTIKGNTTAYPDKWNDASVFYRCNTTIGADMVIEGVVYSDQTEWTLTDNR